MRNSCYYFYRFYIHFRVYLTDYAWWNLRWGSQTCPALPELWATVVYTITIVSLFTDIQKALTVCQGPAFLDTASTRAHTSLNAALK